MHFQKLVLFRFFMNSMNPESVTEYQPLVFPPLLFALVARSLAFGRKVVVSHSVTEDLMTISANYLCEVALHGLVGE